MLRGVFFSLLFLYTLLPDILAAAELPASVKRRREVSHHPLFQKEVPRERVFLVTAVTSPASWHLRRTLLRNQWVKNINLLHQQVLRGHVHAPHIVLKFVVGTEGISSEDQEGIMLEESIHKDILMLHGVSDLEVDYRHLHPNWPWYNTSATAEKVLYSIRWAVNKYDFQYFARIGDDAYFRVDEFYRQAMAKPLPTAMAVFGQMTGPLPYPVAGKENKIIYPSGAGYIMTQDAASFIATAAGMLNVGFPEDANFGAWLAGTRVVFYDMKDRVHDMLPELPLYEPCSPKDILIHPLRNDSDWSRIDAAGLVQC